MDQNSEIGNTIHEPAAAKRKQHRECVKSLKIKKKKSKNDHGNNDDVKVDCHYQEDDEDVDDKAEIENKIVALQKIVPGGGESLEVDTLFEKTAGYILSLQCQVKAMKALTNLFESLEKEKMKLGG